MDGGTDNCGTARSVRDGDLPDIGRGGLPSNWEVVEPQWPLMSFNFDGSLWMIIRVGGAASYPILSYTLFTNTSEV